MNDQRTMLKDTTRPTWVAPMLAAVATWLVWRFGVEAVVLSPDGTTALLGLSVAANVGLVTYLMVSRR